MNPWIAKGVVLAATIVMIVIRAPHGHRSRAVKVVKHRKGALETALLTLAWLSFVAPLVWIASPLLAFADYPPTPVPLAAGIVCFATGLWVFHRSHADLGTNWSITLELRENHRVVKEGVYRRIRHPMYLGLFLYSIGQALVLPNRVAGPSYLVAFTLLYAFRVGREERMMLDEFGAEYEAYAKRTKRLLPGIF